MLTPFALSLSKGERRARGSTGSPRTLMLGGGAGTIKGGRHLVYPADTPLTNLHVTLLNKMGVPAEKLGDSTGQFKELAELSAA